MTKIFVHQLLYFIFISINDFPSISYEFTNILFYEVKERCGKEERVKETKRATQEWGSSDWRESKGWSSTRENCYNVPQYGVVSCELAPRQWKTSGLRERHRLKCILSGPWSVLYRRLPIRHFHSPKSSCSRFFFFFLCARVFATVLNVMSAQGQRLVMF